MKTIDESMYTFNDMHLWPFSVTPENDGMFLAYGAFQDHYFSSYMVKYMDEQWFILGRKLAKNGDFIVSSWSKLNDDELNTIFWTNIRIKINE